MELNAPALERLLGGDTELEVQLRHQVADQFAGKHLKSLLNDKLFNRWKRQLSDEIDATIAEHVGKVTRDPLKKVFLTPSLRDKIREAAEEAAERVFSEATAEKLQKLERSFVDTVDRIQRQATQDLRQAVESVFSEKNIERLVELRVQQRLETAASLGKERKEQRSIDLRE